MPYCLHRSCQTHTDAFSPAPGTCCDHDGTVASPTDPHPYTAFCGTAMSLSVYTIPFAAKRQTASVQSCVSGDESGSLSSSCYSPATPLAPWVCVPCGDRSRLSQPTTAPGFAASPFFPVSHLHSGSFIAGAIESRCLVGSLSHRPLTFLTAIALHFSPPLGTGTKVLFSLPPSNTNTSPAGATLLLTWLSPAQPSFSPTHHSPSHPISLLRFQFSQFPQPPSYSLLLIQPCLFLCKLQQSYTIFFFLQTLEFAFFGITQHRKKGPYPDRSDQLSRLG